MRIWWQGYAPEYGKDAIDGYLNRIEGKFTHVLAAVRPDKRDRIWFESPITPMRDERIDGLIPGQYLIREAHARGIQVDLWFYVGFWWAYAATEGASPNWNMATLPDYPCNAATWLNYSIPEARAFVAEYVGAMVDANDVDGVSLDYLRMLKENNTCTLITADHITETARAIRARIGGNLRMSAAFGRSRDSDRTQKRDPDTWASEVGLFNELYQMGYDWPPDRQHECVDYLRSISTHDDMVIYPGIGTQAYDWGTEDGRYDVFAENLAQYNAWGFHDFNVFDLRNATDAMLALLPELAPEPPPPELPDFDALASLESEAANLYFEQAKIADALGRIAQRRAEIYRME